MGIQGAACPGILTLTTSLSKPFTRLDKYISLLQELERHMEVNLELCFSAVKMVSNNPWWTFFGREGGCFSLEQTGPRFSVSS